MIGKVSFAISMQISEESEFALPTKLNKLLSASFAIGRGDKRVALSKIFNNFYF